MDKVDYFQSIYEAQFALGKKTGACLSAQYLALEAFLQRSNDWHFHWWPIVGVSSAAWKLLQRRATEAKKSGLLSTRGIIRAHLYDRVQRGRELFERDTPLADAWHFYEARDVTVLALTEERDDIKQVPWFPVDPALFGRQSNTVPPMTLKRYEVLAAAIDQKAA